MSAIQRREKTGRAVMVQVVLREQGRDGRGCVDEIVTSQSPNAFQKPQIMAATEGEQEGSLVCPGAGSVKGPGCEQHCP